MKTHDPVTERILAELRRRRMFKSRAAELIGMHPRTFSDRCRRGNWRTGELLALGRAATPGLSTTGGGGVMDGRTEG